MLPCSHWQVTSIEAGVVDVHVLIPERAFQVLLLRRAQGVRSPGAWESVHGNIEPGESPDVAAVRELTEETGLELKRLYSITINPFFVARRQAIQLAVVFCAVVESERPPVLGIEHDAWEWLPFEEALERSTWPKTRQALQDIRHLLRTGDAGPVEDVLRVR